MNPKPLLSGLGAQSLWTISWFRFFVQGSLNHRASGGKLSVRLADMNGDGMIQFEEFVKWLYGSEGLSFLLRHSLVSCATSADMTGKQAA